MLHLSNSLLQMDRSAQHPPRAALLLSQSLLDRKGECSGAGRCRDGQAALIASARTCCVDTWVLKAYNDLMHAAAGADGGGSGVPLVGDVGAMLRSCSALSKFTMNVYAAFRDVCASKSAQ